MFDLLYDLFLSLDVTRWICRGYIFYGKVIREVFTYISTFCWKLVRRSIKRATNFHAIFTRLVASRSGITLVLVLREWFTIRNPEGVRPVSFFSSFIPNALQDYNLELKRPLNELFFAYFRREKRTREKRRVSVRVIVALNNNAQLGIHKTHGSLMILHSRCGLSFKNFLKIHFRKRLRKSHRGWEHG